MAMVRHVFAAEQAGSFFANPASCDNVAEKGKGTMRSSPERGSDTGRSSEQDARPRHPVEVLDSLPAASAPTSPMVTDRILLQDWKPLTETLEWHLSRRTWSARGLDPFVQGEVPHVVNNVAWVAENAAAVLLARVREQELLPDRIQVLELGAGLGLFARQFLASFRRLSREEAEYGRLTYWVTDGSERTVERWEASGLFRDHAPHVRALVCDATRLRAASGGDGGSEAQRAAGPGRLPAASFHLIIANYLFDSLPATIVRPLPGGGFAEMQVRTYLDPDGQREIARRFGWETPELARIVEDPAPDERLASILPYCSFEVAFAPPAQPPRHQDLLSSLDRADRMALNHGAIDCLDSAVHLLRDEGMILYRDLGAGGREAMAERSYSARFGTTVVATLNFPLLDLHLRSLGFSVLAPKEDELRAIHTRLALRGASGAARAFHERFDEDRYGLADAASAEAARSIHEGKLDHALASYRRALELCPDDWQILGQVAQFLTQQMLRTAEALELVEQALEINPEFSAFLWNTFGNCRFVMGDVAGAHQAYLKARAIDPRDVQAHLNLAYTYASNDALDEALEAVARGLASDLDGRFESALLGKQREILTRLEQRRRDENARSTARHRAFTTLEPTGE